MPTILFFGTSDFSVTILEYLHQNHFIPSLVVTQPDKKSGRGLKATMSPVKGWCMKNQIPYIQPETLKDEKLFNNTTWDVGIIASYGKIIPQSVLGIPRRGILNVHPSLLPKYRGASPIESQILSNEKHIGTTIMLTDKQMDHGPILSQKSITRDIVADNIGTKELTDTLAHESGRLLIETLPDWLAETIFPKEQDHANATYTKLIKKEDGLITLDNDQDLQNFLKIKAYEVWPRAHFFIQKGGKKIRVVVTEVEYNDGHLIIKKIIPEGKHEMEYSDFMRSIESI